VDEPSLWHWWQNDPDCLVVRDVGSSAERDNFRRYFPAFAEHPPYGLSDEEAGFWAKLVWMSGGYSFIAEHIKALTPSRLALLESGFPPNPQSVRWMDWYEDSEVAALRTDGDPLIVWVFNLGDKSAYFRPPVARVFDDGRKEWSFRERLSAETFSGKGETIEFPAQPQYSGRVWIARE
jgi:hypothetical protein